MRSKKTQYMTFMAMFLAIEIILVVTPLGYIPIGPLSATTMHIPVIIAGITLGKKAGAQLGLVFGLTSLIRATIQPGITSFCFCNHCWDYIKKKVSAGPTEATAIGNITVQMLHDGVFTSLPEARTCIGKSFDIRHYDENGNENQEV